MKLSKKSRYGLRALIDLAVNSRTELVSLGSIAQRNDISAQYLEHVFSALRKGHIVKSMIFSGERSERNHGCADCRGIGRNL